MRCEKRSLATMRFCALPSKATAGTFSRLSVMRFTWHFRHHFRLKFWISCWMGPRPPEEMFGSDGLLQQLTKALVERSLQAELTHHLGYEKHDPAGHHSGNTRNGASAKTIQGKRGQMQIEVPRDRQSQFEPQIIKKGQRRFDGFDERVISLYARGLSVREIQAHLEEIYGTEVSPDLISTVTDEVLDEVRAWHECPKAIKASGCGLSHRLFGRFASEDTR